MPWTWVIVHYSLVFVQAMILQNLYWKNRFGEKNTFTCKRCCVLIFLITLEIWVFDACQVDVQLKIEILGYTSWITDAILVQYVTFIYFTKLLKFVSNCRQFVAYGESEVCEACRFWSCKRGICDRDDDCRNWDLPLDGSWGLSYSTWLVSSMDKKVLWLMVLMLLIDHQDGEICRIIKAKLGKWKHVCSRQAPKQTHVLQDSGY